MSLYSTDSLEALRARSLLRHASSAGILTQPQYQRLLDQTPSTLRTTNLFLRIVLFFFTIIVIAAAIGLFFLTFFSHPSKQTVAILFLIFAAASYGAAEVAVSERTLYRYGIEEALLASSTGLLFAGLLSLLSPSFYTQHPIDSLPPSLCALFALWIWRRFGLWYAFPAAMIFVALVPSCWTTAHTAQLLILAGIYLLGLIAVIVLANPRPRLDPLRRDLSLAEVLLWLGLYLTLNLKVSAATLLHYGWGRAIDTPGGPRGTFYWITWVLIWGLPPLVLARGMVRKDRLVLQAGALTVLITLLSNKPYLGWPRHTWDPMLLGAFLAGTAWFLHRWLAQGPEGVRHGFTIAALSEEEKRWIRAAAAATALAPTPTVTPDPDHFEFGGGSSGGAGVTGDF